VARREDHDVFESAALVTTLEQLAELLRALRRRHGRGRNDTPLTYRELAAKTGWARGIIGDYFSGKRLAPTDRFDVLVRLLAASAAEQGALATARDRVEEHRRRARSAVPAVTPRQLPPDATAFTGREAQLAELASRLSSAAPNAVIVVSGTAGVGKTALAVHCAHQLADRFPNGCLYVDLRGFSDDTPMPSDQALSVFLHSLGCPAPDIPPAGPELVACYRSLLAGRQMLILLDNAHSAEQVRPLLPGARSCCVLVTSRDQLAGLVARDGAHRIVLDRLSGTDADLLLRSLIGERARAAPDAVTALTRRCARLPLALRVAAELAVSRPDIPIAELVDELADTQRRLDRFDAGGDQAAAVRGTFFWSYRHLADPPARAFRLLGLHPGREFDVPAVAALTGSPQADAEDAVRGLDRANLIEPRRANRYGMHDLLRAYAAELGAAEPADEREPALGRLLAHYQSTAAAAVRALGHAEAPGVAAPAFADSATALDWLDNELGNLVAAAGGGVPGFASTLSATLWRYLDCGGGHANEVLEVHGHALRDAEQRNDLTDRGAALGRLGQALGRLARYQEAIDHMRQSLAISRETGDVPGEMAMLNSMAQAYSRQGHHRLSIEHLDRALAIDRRLGDQASQAKTSGNLGIVHALLGDYATARQHFTEALRLARLVGDANRESEELNNLGLVNCWLGAYDEAIPQLRQGLRIARAIGASGGEGRLHANLGVAYTGLGRITDATSSLARALTIHREVGDRAAEAETLTYVADLQLRDDQPRAALAHCEQALLIAVEIGERNIQAAALNGTGRTLLALDRPDAAHARYARAHSLAVEVGDHLQRAKALDGIAHCLDGSGQHDQALRNRRNAKEIYDRLGVPAPPLPAGHTGDRRTATSRPPRPVS